MKLNFMTIVITIAVAQALVSAQDNGLERSIEGVWQVTFNPYNCDTGEPIPTGTAETLFTFHKDGTISAWAQNNPITVTRSPFHGLWKREKGWNEYSTKYMALQYNLTTGAFGARQISGGSLVLSESGNEYTASSSTTVFFVDGRPPARGCSIQVGTRMTMDQ